MSAKAEFRIHLFPSNGLRADIRMQARTDEAESHEQKQRARHTPCDSFDVPGLRQQPAMQRRNRLLRLSQRVYSIARQLDGRFCVVLLYRPLHGRPVARGRLLDVQAGNWASS
ncbi:hypothetical protein [Burkholderia sp. F1]|uniref:hypothetical protein n=1 Tax=Burkholderia sp. F1 TaxID=3366817 RepID=UPI003D7387E8